MTTCVRCWITRTTAILLALGLLSCERRLDTGPVNLERWSAVNYRLARDSQQYATWVIGEDKQSVMQTENADPSIFVSDRNLDRQTVEGTWLVERSSDDDLIGFVWGYRDPGHFYVFDWKGAAQDAAAVGMSVKLVDTDYDGPPSGQLESGKPFEEHELWRTDGVPPKTRLLHHEDVQGWAFDRPYTFRLTAQPGEFRIVVKDGDRTLYDQTLRDDTYGSGRFGFYNYSQARVVYKGFETHTDTGGARRRLVMVVAGILLLAILAIVARRGRRPTPHLR